MPKSGLREFARRFGRGFRASKKYAGKMFLNPDGTVTRFPKVGRGMSFASHMSEKSIDVMPGGRAWRMGWKARRVINPFLGTPVATGYKLGRGGWKMARKPRTIQFGVPGELFDTETAQVREFARRAKAKHYARIKGGKPVGIKKEPLREITRTFEEGPGIKIGYYAGRHPYKIKAGTAIAGSGTVLGAGGVIHRTHKKKQLTLPSQWEGWERKHSSYPGKVLQREEEPYERLPISYAQRSGKMRKIVMQGSHAMAPLTMGPQPSKIGQKTKGQKTGKFRRRKIRRIIEREEEPQERMPVEEGEAAVAKLKKVADTLDPIAKDAAGKILSSLKSSPAAKDVLADLAAKGSIPAIVILAAILAHYGKRYVRGVETPSERFRTLRGEVIETSTRGLLPSPQLKYPGRYYNRMLASPGFMTMGDPKAIMREHPLRLGSKTGKLRKRKKNNNLMKGILDSYVKAFERAQATAKKWRGFKRVPKHTRKLSRKQYKKWIKNALITGKLPPQTAMQARYAKLARKRRRYNIGAKVGGRAALIGGFGYGGYSIMGDNPSIQKSVRRRIMTSAYEDLPWKEWTKSSRTKKYIHLLERTNRWPSDKMIARSLKEGTLKGYITRHHKRRDILRSNLQRGYLRHMKANRMKTQKWKNWTKSNVIDDLANMQLRKGIFGGMTRMAGSALGSRQIRRLALKARRGLRAARPYISGMDMGLAGKSYSYKKLREINPSVSRLVRGRYKKAFQSGRRTGWQLHSFARGLQNRKLGMGAAGAARVGRKFAGAHKAGRTTGKIPVVGSIARLGVKASADPITTAFLGSIGYGAYRGIRGPSARRERQYA